VEEWSNWRYSMLLLSWEKVSVYQDASTCLSFLLYVLSKWLFIIRELSTSIPKYLYVLVPLIRWFLYLISSSLLSWQNVGLYRTIEFRFFRLLSSSRVLSLNRFGAEADAVSILTMWKFRFFPDFVDNFPDFVPIFFHISRFNVN